MKGREKERERGRSREILPSKSIILKMRKSARESERAR